jgi:hypothetical protein
VENQATEGGLVVMVQGVVTPATVVTACSAALSPLYNWLLVDYFEIGLAGAALANDGVQVRVICPALAMFCTCEWCSFSLVTTSALLVQYNTNIAVLH